MPNPSVDFPFPSSLYPLSLMQKSLIVILREAARPKNLVDRLKYEILRFAQDDKTDIYNSLPFLILII